MSVVLTWETPVSLAESPALRCRVKRGVTTLCQSSTVGVYEDVENNDPEQSYTVEYLDSMGKVVLALSDPFLTIMYRPEGLCKIGGCFMRPDGLPYMARKVTVTDSYTGWHIRDCYSNVNGQVIFFAKVKCSIDIWAEGWPQKARVMVPEQAQVSLNELLKNAQFISERS